MKHTPSITILLIGLFFFSQIVGLTIVDQYIDREASAEEGKPVYKDLPAGFERPDVEENYAFIYILAGILIGTGIFLIIIKFGLNYVWKVWYFLAIFMTLWFALNPFIGELISLLVGAITSFIKTFRQNLIVHNVSEIFVYGGLAAIFVPIINLTTAILLLVLISIYDAYAVWRSKHMVKIAKFQSDSKMFAGLHFDYKAPMKEIKQKSKKTKTKSVKSTSSAILGGGDMGFPLLFAGAAMKTMSYLQVSFIVIGATIGLAVLLYISQKGKFYPAMPFISAGCFAGFGLALLM